MNQNKTLMNSIYWYKYELWAKQSHKYIATVCPIYARNVMSNTLVSYDKSNITLVFLHYLVF